MNKVLIIAEAGVNHNGNIDLAFKLIDEACKAGADIIKFQTFKAENLVTKDAEMAKYQLENTQKKESQFAMLKKLELQYEDYINLKNYAEKKAIKFLSTGFDLESLEFLKTLKMGIWKIPSGEITNRPYLEFVGKLNEVVILSSGMSTMEEVKAGIDVLCESGTKKENIIVLHCTTDYPTKFKDVNLNAMKSIEKEMEVSIGYSDHTEGIEVAIAAVAMGAKVIEKHFTLDKNLPGPDHLASLNPTELSLMIKSIRNIEQSLGNEVKKPSIVEIENIKIARKSIVAKTRINKGEVFSLENLTTKRPGTGLSPMMINSVYGQKASRDFNEDELVEL